MDDDEQSTGMTLNIPGLTDFVGSIWAKILAVLTAISILLGIALEIQSFITGYYGLRTSVYNMRKASADMCDAKIRAIVSSVAGYGPNQPLYFLFDWKNESLTDLQGTAYKLYEKIAYECANLIDQY